MKTVVPSFLYMAQGVSYVLYFLILQSRSKTNDQKIETQHTMETEIY